MSQKLPVHLISSPLAVIEWDENIRVTDWNGSATRLFGFSREEAIGRSALDLIVPERHHEITRALWGELLRSGTWSQRRNANLTKDGRTIMCDWYINSMIDRAGRLLGITSIAVDVTEEARSQRALERGRTLLERSLTFASGLDRQALTADRGLLLRTLSEGAADVLEADGALIGLLSEDRSTMRIVDIYTRRLGSHAEGGDLPAGVLAEIASSLGNVVQAVEDLERDGSIGEGTRRLLGALPARSLLRSRIWLHGGWSGNIVVFRAAPHRWSEEEVVVAGAFGNLIGSLLESVELKRAEARLARREAELRQAISFGRMSYWRRYFEPDRVVISRELQDYFAGSSSPAETDTTVPAPATTAALNERIHPDDAEEYRRRRDAAYAETRPFEAEARYRGADGIYRWFAFQGRPETDADGSARSYLVIAQNIDKRKRAELRLEEGRQTLQRYIAFVNGLDREALVADARLLYRTVTEGAARLLGLGRVALWLRDAEANVMSLTDRYLAASDGHDHGGTLPLPMLQAIMTTPHQQIRVVADVHGDESLEAPIRRFMDSTGTRAFIRVRFQLRGQWAGDLVMSHLDGPHEWRQAEIFVAESLGTLVSGLLDGLERHRAEGILRRSRQEMREALRFGRMGYLRRQFGPDRIVASVALLELIGEATAQEIAQHRERTEGPSFIADRVHPEDRARAVGARELAIATGEPHQAEFRIRHADGRYLHCTWHLLPERDDAGNVVSFFGIVQDITERRQAEAERQRVSGHLQAMLESIEQGVAIFDSDHKLAVWNRPAIALLGLPPDLIRVGAPMLEIQRDLARRGLIAGADADAAARRRYRETVDAANALIDEVRLPDGRITEVRRYPMTDGGQAVTMTDVTEQRAAEEQLRQSQKMEAVGRLTGGIAHDFNNVLAIVLGNLSLLEERATGEPRLLELIEPSLRATERGAELTHRLLAFSRQQPLRPQAIDVAALFEGLGAMLTRTLREDIDVQIQHAPGLWRCMADAGQLEQAVLNLAINARDAMPEGGTLTIELGNASLSEDQAAAQAEVAPGDYVGIAVRDTGHGIAPPLLDRIFEPFFTTKDVGKGTGLGLSMVFGFAKQSGGHVTVCSEEGAGSTFRLYLPRTREEPEDLEPGPAGNLLTGRGERVLVVEDDTDLRALIVSTLRSLGYEVTEAGDAGAALACISRGAAPDLLLTDVVLPGGRNGHELARAVLEALPQAAILYTSGHSEDAIVHHGRLDPGVLLLQKPFAPRELARSVRRALGSRPQHAPAREPLSPA